jgi:acyl-coenzyme A thioesterase PaaI-like protein
MTRLCIQEQYAPHNRCFGCGPANDLGLKIRSFATPTGLVATFQPLAHHEAFPGILNGGIIGAILDCHCNWTAAISLQESFKAEVPPCTVTASYTIELKAPCPTDRSLQLFAQAVEVSKNKCVVEGTLRDGPQVFATCRGIFVAVKQGHPAYHRW